LRWLNKVVHTYFMSERSRPPGQRQATEQALRESEERFRVLVEAASQAVWETDAQGVVVSDSPSWRAYTGQHLEQWLGCGWLDAVHPDDRGQALQQWQEAVRSGSQAEAEFRLRGPGGGGGGGAGRMCARRPSATPAETSPNGSE
jgi:PAS domain-containing protein